MKPAAFGFALVLLSLPFAVRADENLVAKREACRQEARVRIAPRGKVGIDEYRRIVERRNAHVSECMTRIAVVRKDHPLPPQRILVASADGEQVSYVAPVRKKPERIAKRIGRKKLKIASAKRLTGKSLKGRRLRRLDRWRK